MNKFKEKIIPDKIHFCEFMFKDLFFESVVSDKTKDCSYMTNGGLDIDPYEGVSKENKNCEKVGCYKCIFFELNAKERLEYFKSLKENR